MVPGVEGHRLPGESDLKQEGDPVDGAPGVGAAGGRLAAVGQPAAERGRWAGGRRRGGRGHVMREGGEGARGGRQRRRAVVGRHWLLSVTSSEQQEGAGGQRHPKMKKCLRFVRQPSVARPLVKLESRFSAVKS